MYPVKHLLSAVALAAMSATSFAATVYTSSASFLSQVAAGAYTESFTGLSDPSTGSFASGAYAYSATATSGLYVSGGFLGTSQINEVLTVSFTSGNVKAFGANFYVTDFNDQFQAVAVTLNLSDGTTTSFTPTSIATSYRGFTSNVPIASFTISAPGQSLYAGLDNLTVGTVIAVPEPSALVLASVGALGLAARLRRRNNARSHA